MLLSRFWYLFIAILAGVGGAAAMLAMGTFNRQYDADVNDALRRDRLEIELTLRMDARARIDAIGPIAAQPDVRTALRQASGRRDPNVVDAALRTSVETKLADLNRQLEEMRGDLLFAVDDDGYIVGQAGGSQLPAGAALGQFPLVRRALEGYLRDDVWVWNGQVYRMAARPVIDSGQYVGAIVHGKQLDEELARKLSERIAGRTERDAQGNDRVVSDATVVFFMRDRVVSGHMPTIEGAARREDVEAQLAQALQNPRVQQGNSSDPIDVGTSARAIYSLITGSASHAMVGYAISRPRQSLATPFDIFQRATAADVDSVMPQLIMISAGAFVLFLLAMFWVWVERDRPLSKLVRATQDVAKGEKDRLTVTDFAARHRKIAENMNAAIDRAVEKAGAGGPKRRAADLDQILGPTPGESSPQFFGFAGDQAGPADIPAVPPAPEEKKPPAGPAPRGAPPAPAPAPGPMFAPPPPNKPAAPPPPAPGPRPPGPPPPVPGRGGPPPPAPPRPPAAPAAAPPPPAAAPAPLAASAGVAPAGSAGASSGSGSGLNKPSWAKGTLVGMPEAAPPSQEFGDEDEAATTIAQVPEDLLKNAAAGAASGDTEQKHFREVFEQFLSTKKQCGENVAGLTFDKFVQTLRKNKEQIVSRHGAKNVRFTVYVKDGKAALKATPVRD